LHERPSKWKKSLKSLFTTGAWSVCSGNHCAYMVQKNITCILQDGVETYVKAEYTTKCIWGQKCPVIMYRTFHRPTYKVGYKTVTELEWKCCPGYSGEACHGGPTSLPDIIGPHRPGIKGFPHGPRPPVDQKPGGAPLDPGERLDRMELDLRRLTQETNKLLVSLLTNPPRTPDSTVGFGVIPDGLEGGGTITGFGDLAGRVTEVKDELRAKSHILEEIQGMVIGHDGQLKKLLDGATGESIPGPGSTSYLDEILDIKLAGVRAEILDGFERRLTGMENHCEEKIGEMQRQCQKEHLDGQEQMQQSLDGRETGLREELGTLQAQIQGLTLTESCCGQVNSLSERMLRLEESVKDITESQRQLQTVLSDQTLHIETLVETRLVDMEGRLNATNGEPGGVEGFHSGLDGFKTLLEDKLKTLEERVFVAVEELSNATTPALLEGQVSTPQEEVITDTLTGEECKGMDKKMINRLDSHSTQLDHLNNTLNNLLLRIAQEESEGSVQGEITLLKVNINSVNRTLKGLKDSISFIATEVGHVNSSWEQKEHQIVNQVQGITKLMGHQASLLGASERRLAELRGELAALKRQLSGGLQGCRSTAMEVQKEVKVVDSRVSQVESQCSSLGELAENLERIRAELEKHSVAILRQVNGTMTSHSEQLDDLKGDFASKDATKQNNDQ
uniref:Elastin microfibril interfacer 3 n=1 Tax=Xiphophorus maculatus TaxID=8083 RepID=A0A3B5QD71_XIPMA